MTDKVTDGQHDNVNPLFRPQALAKVTDPDQLDQSLRLVRPCHLLGFGVVAVVLGAGLAWSLIATAPVNGEPGSKARQLMRAQNSVPSLRISC